MPLAVASGILAIFEIMQMIIQFVDAPKNVKTLETELRGLETFLSQMKTNITSNSDFEGAFCDRSLERNDLSDLRIIVDNYTEELKVVIDKLKKRENDGLAVWNRLTGPFVAKTTRESLDHFHRRCQVASGVVAINTAEEVKKTRKEQQEWYGTVRGRKILQWLSPLNFQQKQRDILAKRYPETGSWFLNLDKFRSWRDGDATKSSTLWCPGIPGAGKTVMTSIVVDHLREKFIGKGFAFAFVYCDYKDLKNQTALNLISSLVQQLAQQGSCIPEEVCKAFADHDDGKRAPRLDEYTRLLQSLSSRFPRTFICVDALDECSSDNQEDRSHQQVLLDVLLGLQQFSSDCSLFITSRMNGQIEEKLAKHTRIEIRAADTDVGSYIRSRITDSSKFRFAGDVMEKPDLCKIVVAKLVENAKGMFLLPRLHLDLLGSQTSVRLLRRALDYLPTELDDTYDNAMARIEAQPEGDRTLAMQALSWISHALRPLRTNELQHALAVEPGDQKLDEEGVPSENLLISVCAGLISIDVESSTIGLVHFTVEEYFKNTRRKWFPNAAVHMAKTCLTYISFGAFSGGSCRNDQELDKRLCDYPFLQYAVRNWGIHAHDDPEPEVNEAARKFLEDKSKLSSFIQARDCPPYKYAGFSQRFTKGVTGLQVASAFGLTEVASLLLENGADVKALDEDGCTALHWAAKNGHEAVVHLLLEEMDDIDYKQGEAGWKALYWAAKNGHEAVVQLLIKRGTNIANAWDDEERTALHWAAVNGHEAVVRLLLEGGANIEEVDQQGVTPLHWAAKGGSEAVVQLLLDKGANVEARDTDGRTPLHRAAENGHGRVIQLLVENRANAKAEDIYGRIVLCVAIWHENEAAAQLLASLTPPDLKREALSVLASGNPRVKAFAYKLLMST